MNKFAKSKTTGKIKERQFIHGVNFRVTRIFKTKGEAIRYKESLVSRYGRNGYCRITKEPDGYNFWEGNF